MDEVTPIDSEASQPKAPAASLPDPKPGSDPSQTCFRICMVHGTFARRTEWARDNSDFQVKLSRQLNAPATFHRFDWSGLPTHTSRHRAAKRLEAFLAEQLRLYPDDRHVIIAHSHGANAALYALRNPALLNAIDGVIAVSSTFLVPRKRDLNMLGNFALQTGAFGLLLFLLVGLPILLVQQFGPSPSKPWPESWPDSFETVTDFIDAIASSVPWLDRIGFAIVGATIAIVYLAICAAIFAGIAMLLDRGFVWLNTTLPLPQLPAYKLLIIRGPNDEASALLLAAQLLETILSAFWDRGGLVDSAIRLYFAIVRRIELEILARPRLKLFLSVWGGAILLELGLIFILDFVLDDSLFIFVKLKFFIAIAQPPYVTATILFIVFFPTIAALLLGLPVVAVIALSGLLLLALLLSSLVCVAVLMLVVVPEIGLFVAFLAVSGEPSPPGEFTIMHFAGARKRRALWHSTTFANPRARAAMAHWIQQRLHG